MAQSRTFLQILKKEGIGKSNPYHDSLGRFTFVYNAAKGIDIISNSQSGRYGYLVRVNTDPNYEIHPRK